MSDKLYNLYEIVKHVNGGDIKPIGETNYDTKAFERMQEIKILTEALIDDLVDIADMSGNEASIDEARKDTKKFLNNIRDILNDTLNDTLD